jgi:hypothetical protein
MVMMNKWLLGDHRRENREKRIRKECTQTQEKSYGRWEKKMKILCQKMIRLGGSINGSWWWLFCALAKVQDKAIHRKSVSDCYINNHDTDTGNCQGSSGGRFQVLMVTNMKIAAFGDVAQCSLVEIDWCFQGSYCLHQALLVSFCRTTRHNIPEDSHLRTRHCENLKSHYHEFSSLPWMGSSQAGYEWG